MTVVLLHLTRVDGKTIVMVRDQIVSWTESLDHAAAQRIDLSNGRFQDVTETSEEINDLMLRGKG